MRRRKRSTHRAELEALRMLFVAKETYYRDKWGLLQWLQRSS
jgi:hypothetical protein